MMWQTRMSAAAVLCLVATPVLAGDFRVETEVFVDRETAPVCENLVLFQAGVVYDVMQSAPHEVTIFDLKRGQILLLDPTRKVRSAISPDQLLQVVAELQAQAQQGKPRVKFLAQPAFSTNFDAATNRLTLASDFLTYTATGTSPKDPAAITSWREFADWSARLNATRPGSLLPFSRMVLNQALAERELAPTEVEFTMTPENRLAGKKVVMHSKQVFSWRLLETDLQKIAKAGADAAAFKLVGFEEFRQLDKSAQRKD